ASGPAIASTRTDSDGKFFLPDIVPGTYRLVAVRTGYVTAEFGQRYSDGPGLSITVAAGQRLTDIRIAMTRGAVISGRITDRGRPVPLAEAVAVRAITTE